MTRKTAPKGTAGFVAVALAQDASTIAHVGANQFTADLLGLPSGGYGTNSALSRFIGEASDARAQVLSLAIVLAAYEDNTHTGSWRSVDPGTAHCLLFLEQCAYTLRNVERRAAGLDPLPDAEPASTDSTEDGADQGAEAAA